jgi:hypothetical protein
MFYTDGHDGDASVVDENGGPCVLVFGLVLVAMGAYELGTRLLFVACGYETFPACCVWKQCVHARIVHVVVQMS